MTIINEKSIVLIFFCSFILNGYSSGIPGISLGSWAFLLIIIILLLSKKTLLYKYIFPIVIFCLIFIIFSVIGMSQNAYFSMNSFFVGLLKLVIWFCMICIVAPNLYDKKLFAKIAVSFGIVLTTYIIIQTIAFYAMNLYLPNIFNFGPFKPYDAEYANYESLGNGAIIRAASLFSESSFYGNFMLCVLVLYLDIHYLKMEKKKWLLSLFFSLGIFLSTSTSAMVFLVMIWFFYLIKMKVNKGILAITGLTAILIAALAVYLQIIDLDSKFLSSFEYAFEKFTYLGKSSRVGKSYGYLSYLSGFSSIFGVGVGNDISFIQILESKSEIYVNSVTSILFQGGWFSFIAFILMLVPFFCRSIKNKNTASIMLLLMYFIKGFASTLYFSTYGILFMFLIIGELKPSSMVYTQINKENLTYGLFA